MVFGALPAVVFFNVFCQTSKSLSLEAPLDGSGAGKNVLDVSSATLLSALCSRHDSNTCQSLPMAAISV